MLGEFHSLVCPPLSLPASSCKAVLHACHACALCLWSPFFDLFPFSLSFLTFLHFSKHLFSFMTYNMLLIVFLFLGLAIFSSNILLKMPYYS